MKSRISGMMSLLLGASVLGPRTELLVPEQPLYDDDMPPRKQRRTEEQKRKKKARQQRKKSRG